MTYHMDISSWVLTSLKNLNDAVGYNDGIEEFLLLGGGVWGGVGWEHVHVQCPLFERSQPEKWIYLSMFSQ